MAAPAGRLSDDRYINWIKDTLALIHLKDGLEVFVDNQSAVFHSHLITTLGSQACGTCSSRNLIKRKGQWTINCPVCHPWLTEIISKHKYRPQPVLAPGNTDPKLWTTDAWEVMKLFQVKGYQDQHSARDTDVAGILALIANCDHFHSFINNMNLVDQIRVIRNRVMHSSDLHVETVDLGRDLQTMLQFLRGLMSLSVAEQDAVDIAIERIQELQTGLIDLSLNKELELRALQQKQNALDADLNSVKHELAATSEKACTTEDAVHTIKADLGASNAKRIQLETDLTEKIKSVGERLKKLQAVQDSFNRFLQANNLEQDMARLSTALEHHDQRIKNVETQALNLDVTTKQQENEIATLYQRQQASNTELQERLRDSQALKFQLQAHSTMLESHHGGLEHVNTELQERQRDFQVHESQLQTHTTMLASHSGRLERVEERLQNQVGNAHKEPSDTDITEIRKRLLLLYGKDFQLIPIYPLEPSWKEPVNSLYVCPFMKQVDHQTSSDIYDQEPQNPFHIRDVFYTNDKRCENICIFGEPGIGKSTFCKNLISQWVTVTRNETDDDPVRLTQDQRTLQEFKLLFYVELSKSHSGKRPLNPVEVAYLILDQLDLYDLCSILTIRKCLRNPSTLVLLDGMNEYSRVPPKGLYDRHTLVITRRTFEPEALSFDLAGHFDKQIELMGLSGVSISELADKLLVRLNHEYPESRKNVSVFLREIQTMDSSAELLKTPQILILILRLWFDGGFVECSEKTQLEICRKVIHHMIIFDAKSEVKLTYQAHDTPVFPIDCNIEMCPCKSYSKVLWMLAMLAYCSIMESFDIDQVQMSFLGFSLEEIRICFSTGMLKHNKLVKSTRTRQQKKFSFTHRLVQEYFACTFLLKYARVDITSLGKVQEFKKLLLLACEFVEIEVTGEEGERFDLCQQKEFQTQLEDIKQELTNLDTKLKKAVDGVKDTSVSDVTYGICDENILTERVMQVSSLDSKETTGEKHPHLEAMKQIIHILRQCICNDDGAGLTTSLGSHGLRYAVVRLDSALTAFVQKKLLVCHRKLLTIDLDVTNSRERILTSGLLSKTDETKLFVDERQMMFERILRFGTDPSLSKSDLTQGLTKENPLKKIKRNPGSWMFEMHTRPVDDIVAMPLSRHIRTADKESDTAGGMISQRQQERQTATESSSELQEHIGEDAPISDAIDQECDNVCSVTQISESPTAIETDISTLVDETVSEENLHASSKQTCLPGLLQKVSLNKKHDQCVKKHELQAALERVVERVVHEIANPNRSHVVTDIASGQDPREQSTANLQVPLERAEDVTPCASDCVTLDLDELESTTFDGRLIHIASEKMDRLMKATDTTELARGAFGITYLCKVKLNEKRQDMVVKEIRCKDEMDNRRSAIKEMLASRLKHHHIVPIIAFSEHKSNEIYYFLMPYMTKGNLYNAIMKDTELKAEHILTKEIRSRVLLQLATVLEFLHQSVGKFRGKYVHGDVSSKNIVLDEEFNIRLLDFGLSKEVKGRTHGSTEKSSNISGTPGYVPDDSKIRPERDCYSWAAIALELLTGLPAIGKNKKKLMDDNEVLNNRASKIKTFWGTQVLKKGGDGTQVLKEGDDVGCIKQLVDRCKAFSITAKEIVDELKILMDGATFITKYKKMPTNSKCLICMIGEKVEGDILRHACEVDVCVACLRNSYLNPIKCPHCLEDLPSPIGDRWGAILIAGNDVKDVGYANAFKNDVDKVYKTITSKRQLVMGIRKERVKKVYLPKDVTTGVLQQTLVTAFNVLLQEDISTLLLYFSGHTNEKREFILGNEMETISKQNLGVFLKDSPARLSKLIIILDYCFPEQSLSFLPDNDNPDSVLTTLQITSCGPCERANADEDKGSVFTDFFVQCLKGRSVEGTCLNLADQQSECRVCLDTKLSDKCRDGFVSTEYICEYIDRHIKDRPKKRQTPTFSGKNARCYDMKVGYYRAYTAAFKFEFYNGTVHELMELPDTINELMKLLHNPFKDKLGKDDIICKHFTDVFAIAVINGTEAHHQQELTTMESIEAAWNGLSQLHVVLRNVTNIDNGKVGFVLNEEIKPETILAFVSKVGCIDKRNVVSIPIGDLGTLQGSSWLESEDDDLEECQEFLTSEIIDCYRTKETTGRFVFTFPLHESGQHDNFFTVHIKADISNKLEEAKSVCF